MSCPHWSKESGYAQASLYAACPWCEIERLTKERDKYREVLRICSSEAEKQLREELHRLRNNLTAAHLELDELRGIIRQAIEGHKVWESIYGSSPTSRAHLAVLESGLHPGDKSGLTP